MFGWYFIISALALLAAVLLFGFVGCTSFGSVAETMGPDYPTTIKNTPDLVAYWRLGNLPTAGPGGDMKDSFGKFDGDHHQYPAAITTPDNIQHSPTSTSHVNYGETPGLLETSPNSPCYDTDGGWVLVHFDDALNPPQFTLEVWVSPDPLMAKGYFHCLVQSAGPGLTTSLQKTGWGLFLGPDDPNKTPPDDFFWQVWMGDGAQFKRVAIANGTMVPTLLRLTALVLTFDGANLQLWLYYPQYAQNLDVPHLLAAQAKVTTFKRNDTSPIGQGPFMIGVGNPLFTGGGPYPNPIYPFKGKIQEMALYKRDLSAPNNTGLQTTLLGHLLAGANL
jgi:hypothetical protein